MINQYICDNKLHLCFINNKKTLVFINYIYTYLKEYMDIYSFKNNGNLCYLICALQVLLSNSLFKEFIIKFSPIIDNKLFTITNSIINSSIIYTFENYRYHSVVSINSLKNELGKLNNFFNSNEQQDIQECLLLLIEEYSKVNTGIKIRPRPRNIYHTEYSSEILKLYDEYINNFDKKYNYNFIHNTFMGCYKLLKKCNNCDKESLNFEIFLHIDLIPKINCSIVKCITEHFNSEIVNLDCENCKCDIFNKKFSIMTFPKYLIVSIKRYTEDSLNIEVLINDNFSIKLNDLTVFYKLKIVVHHIGNVNSGHYYIKQDRFIVNDDKIIDTFKKDTLSKTIYLAMYELNSH